VKSQCDPRLVERIARAIFRASQHDDGHFEPWSNYVEETHEHYRVMARAAIKALRRAP